VNIGLSLAPADGKLGILMVGLGAVSTTTIAGVMAVRKGLAKPIGSLAEMGTVRLGKRTDGRSPSIREFVPLTPLDDIVFGGWDIFEDNCYEAAKHAGVLEAPLLEQVKDELAGVTPMSAVFDRHYVKRLDGPNVKKGKNKRDLAEQLIQDIRSFKAKHGLARLVMVWCGSTEIFLTETAAHQTIEAFEKGLEENDISIPSSMIYAYAAIKEGIPYANAAPNLSADVPALMMLAQQTGAPLAGKDLKTGQTWLKTVIAPGTGGTRPIFSGTATARCSTIPSRSRRRKRARSRYSTTSCSPSSTPSCTTRCTTSCGSTITSRGVTTKKAGTISTFLVGSGTRCS
jgi:myo-inositol-1-phosphate synthase